MLTSAGSLGVVRMRHVATTCAVRCARKLSLGTRNIVFGDTDSYVDLARGSAFHKQEINNLKAVFRDVVVDLQGLYADIPGAGMSLEQVLLYNVPGGKLYRVLAFLHTYTQLCRVASDDEVPRLKYVMGVCIELLQASGLALDDLVDGSELRRGKPSWHTVTTANPLSAINHVAMMRSSVFILLQRYFGDQSYYPRVLRLFHQVLHNTLLGQAVDLRCSGFDGLPRLELFTMDKYCAMAKYKTGFYTFYLPVIIALSMAGCNDVRVMTQLEDILLEMGIFYQIQNDYWDCYKEAGLTGKQGNDIQAGKCTWLAVVGLQHASAKQHAVFRECYGRPQSSQASAILELYEELGVGSKYEDHERVMYETLCAKIRRIPATVPHHVLYSILNMLFRKQ